MATKEVTVADLQLEQMSAEAVRAAKRAAVAAHTQMEDFPHDHSKGQSKPGHPAEDALI